LTVEVARHQRQSSIRYGLRWSKDLPREVFVGIARIVIFASVNTVMMSLASPPLAGSCAAQISRTREQISSYLNHIAEAGPTSRESLRATSHRQPTPADIAAAETALGELDSSAYAAIAKAMAQAHDFDQRGDQISCWKALQEVSDVIAGHSRCGRSSCGKTI
jgi:hypothetical protein